MKVGILGVLGAVLVTGCASQMVQNKAKDMCAQEGKRPFLFDSQHEGIPLLIDSASVTVLCIGPDDIAQTPRDFGADITGGSGLRGVGVVTVTPGSKAEVSGLKPGDVIYEWAGAPISKPLELQRAIRDTPEGQQVTIKLRREKHDIVTATHF